MPREWENSHSMVFGNLFEVCFEYNGKIPSEAYNEFNKELWRLCLSLNSILEEYFERKRSTEDKPS